VTRARYLVQRFTASEMEANTEGDAAHDESNFAQFDALIGNLTEAKIAAMKATQMFADWLTLGRAGIVFALAGDSAEAQKLATDLNQRLPDATGSRFYYLPAI